MTDKIFVGRKVSEIEFHFKSDEADDFILRAANLIKDGYHIFEIYTSSIPLSIYDKIYEPNIHIKFKKDGK